MSKRTSPRISGAQADLYRELAALDVDGMQRRVKQMAAAGIGEHTIAEFLKLRVDHVRRILSDHTHTERGV
jgi:hypothetical protein